MMVADEEVIKVHVHTNDPGLAIQKGLSYGPLSRMKIDNMRLEHQEKLFRTKDTEPEETLPLMPAKDVALIAVCAGKGLSRIFSELGVDYIIEGGQTMNPSTEDMLNAIDMVNADTVFILPNNKNIILAANQAQSLVKDKKIVVIPTKTVPQGITAVINYVPDLSVSENEETMLAEMKAVATGQVTYAVRDTNIDGQEIRQGDFMGLGDHGILSVGTAISTVAMEMVEAMMSEEKELISIYYGEEITREDAENLKSRIAQKHQGCDIELQYGGQPIYYYIISAE